MHINRDKYMRNDYLYACVAYNMANDAKGDDQMNSKSKIMLGIAVALMFVAVPLTVMSENAEGAPAGWTPAVGWDSVNVAANADPVVGGTALKTAIEGAAANTVIWVAAGTYAVDEIKITNKNLAIAALDNTKVTIRPTDANTTSVFRLEGTSNVIFDNLSIAGVNMGISGNAISGGWYGGAGLPGWAYTGNMDINNCTISGFGKYGVTLGSYGGAELKTQKLEIKNSTFTGVKLIHNAVEDRDSAPNAIGIMSGGTLNIWNTKISNVKATSPEEGWFGFGIATWGNATLNFKDDKTRITNCDYMIGMNDGGTINGTVSDGKNVVVFDEVVIEGDFLDGKGVGIKQGDNAIVIERNLDDGKITVVKGTVELDVDLGDATVTVNKDAMVILLQEYDEDGLEFLDGAKVKLGEGGAFGDLEDGIVYVANADGDFSEYSEPDMFPWYVVAAALVAIAAIVAIMVIKRK